MPQEVFTKKDIGKQVTIRKWDVTQSGWWLADTLVGVVTLRKELLDLPYKGLVHREFLAIQLENGQFLTFEEG